MIMYSANPIGASLLFARECRKATWNAFSGFRWHAAWAGSARWQAAASVAASAVIPRAARISFSVDVRVWRPAIPACPRRFEGCLRASVLRFARHRGAWLVLVPALPAPRNAGPAGADRRSSSCPFEKTKKQDQGQSVRYRTLEPEFRWTTRRYAAPGRQPVQPAKGRIRQEPNHGLAASNSGGVP
jgi:hypothetical protein